MILHLIDDEKIAPRTIELFEKALPGQNCFICFRLPVQRVTPSKIVIYDDQVNEIDITKYNKVFIHYLSNRKIEFYLKYIKSRVETYWFVWGGDVYNDLMTSRGYDTYYEPLYGGGRIFLKNRLAKVGVKPYFKDILNFIREHVDYVISSLEGYASYKKYLGKYLPPHYDLSFFYYPIDQIVGEKLMGRWCNVDSKKIIVGNCATVSNNHLYAFKYLKKCDLTGYEVIPILSYGGTKKYISHVNKSGKDLFGNKYNPQTEFLSIDEYNAFMCESSIYVYGNWRQEAFGNLVIALYLGAKVFISQKNPYLTLFQNKGVTVFELEKMDEDSLIPLTESKRHSNREIMLSNYNESLLLDRIRKAWSD